MAKQIALATSKDILVKQTVNVLKKKIPIIGLIFEGYESYSKAVEDKLLQDLLATLGNSVKNLDLKFDESWIKTEDGEKFCSKVLASALNAEFVDKQELFANALLNGIVISETESAEKFKFIDMLRQLSRPSLDVLAVMYKLKHKINGFSVLRLADTVVNSEIAKESLKGMDYYCVNSCIVEIRNVGLFSSATEVYHDERTGKYRVAGSYSESSNAEAYTEFTQRFIEFITQKSVDN